MLLIPIFSFAQESKEWKETKLTVINKEPSFRNILGTYYPMTIEVSNFIVNIDDLYLHTKLNKGDSATVLMKKGFESSILNEKPIPYVIVKLNNYLLKIYIPENYDFGDLDE